MPWTPEATSLDLQAAQHSFPTFQALFPQHVVLPSSETDNGELKPDWSI